MNVYNRLTAPAETQEFIGLIEKLSSGRSSPKIHVKNVQGSGVSHFAALLGLKTKRDILVILQDKSHIRGFITNTRSLNTLISPEVPVIGLPYLDIEPYSKTEPHFQITVERSLAFHLAASSAGRKIIATTPENLIYPVPPVSFSAGRQLDLFRGNEMIMENAVRFLESSGYRRRSLTEAVGEYSVRGGIIDAFSPLFQAPVRIEFEGDEINSLRVFDPSNQISIEELDFYRLAPVSEFDTEKIQKALPTDNPTLYFDYPRIYPQQSTILEYLNEPLLIFTDRRGTESAIEEMRKVFATRYRTVEEGTKISPPEKILLPPDKLEKMLGGTASVYLSDSGGKPVDAETSLNITGLDWSARSGMVEEGIRNAAAEAKKSQELVIFTGDAVKAAALIENSDLAPFRPAMISERQPAAGMRWRVGAFITKDQEKEGKQPASVKTSSDLLIELHEKPALVPLPFEGSYNFSDLNICIIGSSDIFTPEAAKRRAKKRKYFSFSLQDLKEGDYVIHYEHGIGLYRGLKKIEREGVPAEYMELEYAEKHILYVPLERMDLIDRYISLEGVKPHLDSLGSKKWITRRQRVKKSLFDMAGSLLNLYASRQLIQGWKFSEDGSLQHTFEQLFPYQETDDQLQAIEDVKKDMESVKPMDRLIVGDVGFGKTEVAIRAAFKAAADGKQTAIIAPTTVLAFQHHRNFKARLEQFPFKTAMLSRLVDRKEQKKIIETVEKGEIDIIIGTHRLLSKDIKFHNLGLLVIDEEQRFGVGHKERIKMLKHQLDVITLTATPIPRTLNLALMGIRDLSLIETPPENRLSVKTEIVPFDMDILSEAVSREISRGGQVYFVHNRIDNIEMIAGKIREMQPKARILIAHGRMDEGQLEKVMLSFISGEADILISTTIIENGIDIPNVNTLIVNNAHMFGLAQLYQLRGRVGRSERQAYCYLVVPEYSSLSADARTRLQTLIEFSRLGSGFRIAAMDMELRGSGNILGDEQSGHISEVGFDLYCRMLEEAVAELRGDPSAKKEELKPSIELQANIAIPESYIPQTDQRLALYRRVSSAETEEELEQIKSETADRYGKPPLSFHKLMDYGWLRVQCWKYSISKISRDGDKMRMKLGKSTSLGPKEIYNFCSRTPGSVFLPDGQLIVSMQKEEPLTAAKKTLQILVESSHYTAK